MRALTLQDIPLQNKRVLMRVDFNVPFENGKITDDTKIVASLESIEYIIKKGAKLILISHLGRPDGKKDEKYTLSPCAKRLGELLKKHVLFIHDCIGQDVEKQTSSLKPGEVCLLENLRFYEAEENPEKDPSFVKQLSHLADIYINDAFGTAHRAHSSTVLIADFFPKKAAIGFLMQKEIKQLSNLIKNPNRPFYAIIGGAKISSKIGLIKNLLNIVDGVFIGGAMSFTFLKAQGIDIGSSPCEDINIIKELDSSKIHLPLDLVIADNKTTDAHKKIISCNTNIPHGWAGYDIGPKTINSWGNLLSKAATIFWNGPLGLFEVPTFANGTRGIAEIIAQSKANSLIGGGDTVAAIQQMGLGEKFSHLSTGGGASLEFIEFGHLPGIDAIERQRNS